MVAALSGKSFWLRELPIFGSLLTFSLIPLTYFGCIFIYTPWEGKALWISCELALSVYRPHSPLGHFTLRPRGRGQTLLAGAWSQADCERKVECLSKTQYSTSTLTRAGIRRLFPGQLGIQSAITPLSLYTIAWPANMERIKGLSSWPTLR